MTKCLNHNTQCSNYYAIRYCSLKYCICTPKHSYATMPGLN